MKITHDLRRFRVSNILFATFTIACSFAFWQLSALIPSAAITFWVGIVLFAISDSVDSRPIDERSKASGLINFLGLILFIASLVQMLLGIGSIALSSLSLSAGVLTFGF